MSAIRDMARKIIAREGGFVADPDDPGGPTNYGVTLKSLRAFGDDLNQDGLIDIQDLRALSPEHALEIFVKHYFLAPGIPDLPQVLHETLFDMYVHSGRNAVRLSQSLFAKMGFSLAIDGLIGPQTRRVAQDAYQAAPEHIADAYAIERRNYYFSLADRRKKLRKYVRRSSGLKGGWITRAESFMAPRYHLSAADFRKRIARWV